MNISAPFIKRPVMTILCTLSTIFFGVFAYWNIPTSSLPNVGFPIIQVSINYPGASATVIAETVVVPLEQQFATIEGIQSIASTSYFGQANIVLQFVLDRDIDLAAPDVQAAINAAGPQLPKDLPYTPTYTKVNPNATPILIFALTSTSVSSGDLYNYANTLLSEPLSMIEGVSQVQSYGSPYAVRLRVDPQKLAAKNIDINQVGETIKASSVMMPTGALYGHQKNRTIQVNGQLGSAQEFNPVVIKEDNGAIVRFQDIGEAIDSVQNDKTYYAYFDKEHHAPMIALAIRKQPSSNTLDVIERVNQTLPSLTQMLPGNVDCIRLYDQTAYIQESVHDVEFTLLVALALVVFVVFAYLGTIRNTIIPIVAIPLSILGTFLIMLQLGFTLDILSLLALTLSIGFLVDDAIVVLENTTRRIELGESVESATLLGAEQIGITVFSMTLSLCTVFIPLVFMAGIVGRILHEFAITIVSAIAISGVISLTLTPLLCRYLLKAKGSKKPSMFERFSQSLNDKILNWYTPRLTWSIKHGYLMLAIGVLSLVSTIYLMGMVPKAFFPPDDLGLIQAFIRTPDGTAPEMLFAQMESLGEELVKDPNIDSVIAIGGSNKQNEGIYYIRLKPFNERSPMPTVVESLTPIAEQILGTQLFLKPLQLLNLEVGSATSKASYQWTLRSADSETLNREVPLLVANLRQSSLLTDVISDLDIAQPQLNIDILRDEASSLGISAFAIENALGYAYGGVNLSPINTPYAQYYAIMETLPEFYQNSKQLQQLWLTSITGDLVPLSSVVKMSEGTGALTVNHIDTMPAATISFNVASNTALDTALQAMEQIVSHTISPQIASRTQGSTTIFKAAFSSLQTLLLITIFLLYVILGVLYEDFFAPLIVMSTLPPSAFGGVLSLLITGQELSIYAFVGLVMLLGIVLKNGIMLVDFAHEEELTGKKTTEESIISACQARCRPILMTTFSSLMGAVPIALGVGGMTAQSHRSLGIVIVGGLCISQLLTLFLTPVAYIYIRKIEDFFIKTGNPNRPSLGKKLKGKAGRFVKKFTPT